jgi:uncharacterized protein
LLLSAGANPHLASQDLETALHFAAIEGNLELVELLLGHGAPTDVITSLGDTPLVLATLHEQTTTVAAILKSGTDLQAHRQGETALGIAIVNGYSEIASLLLAAGVSSHQTLKDGQTPAIFAAIEGNIELIRSLIAASASLDDRDDTGSTALMWATHRQHHEIIALLLAAGVDRTCKNHGGLTALALAEINSDRRSIDLLKDN